MTYQMAATAVTLNDLEMQSVEHLCSVLARSSSALAELPVYFAAPDDISGTAKARLVKFCTQVGLDYIKSTLAFG